MCDMCSSPEIVYRIEVEGSMLNVCEKCSSYGRVVAKIRQAEPEKKKKKQEKAAEEAKKAAKTTETMQVIVSNYSDIIKRAREKSGLKQEELAKKIAEKESIIHKLESGIIKPDISLARKLEKFLKILLVEEVETESIGASEKKRDSEGLTIGDMIKIRKR